MYLLAIHYTSVGNIFFLNVAPSSICIHKRELLRGKVWLPTLDKIGMKFQRLAPCFRGQAIQRDQRESCTMKLMLYDETGSGKSNLSMFSESSYPMRSTRMLYDQTGSGKFNIVTPKHRYNR